ncbi:hypothetical protein AB0K20_31750 [Micromonospora matsumotoense]|uniref:Uncharacterized protein n=1 Tax=Micromonospora matsumotoense TaxID=121616 RepID=A0A1C5ASH8_9ACTN|nr:hypothetical protein [Micromonospora matsumotoense]SCF48169.1 hypothetical protein GA0070216_12570 [Micromonospora matsumotoense]
MRGHREVPYLVELSWRCLDHHRNARCEKCTGTGFCPAVEAARTRIRTWRRYRTVFGRR